MDDSLVARRPKRSTAGNRMEAALAEFRAEDIGMDVDEDGDFALDKAEEDDVFGSDFESTDEEVAQEDVDAIAEKLIRQEESRVRKTARTQLERITALAHARQAATFNPVSIAPPPLNSKGENKLKRRVSLGVAINAETGEVLEGGAEADALDAPSTPVTGGKRHSTRAHTVANTSATFTRARDELRKQASVTKRTKTQIKAPTQEELMKRAFSMEAGNIEEHTNYLKLEEEKRRKARVVRASVQAPLIRWISKKEEVTVLVQPSPTAAIPSPHLPYRYPSTPASPSPTFTQHYNTASTHPSSQPSFQQWPPAVNSPPQHQLAPPANSATPTRPLTGIYNPFVNTAQQMPYAQTHAHLVLMPTIATSPPSMMPPPSGPIERTEAVAKQFVIHEVTHSEKSRPSWHSTMTAMFGDHVDWEKCRVYTTKGRPLTRPTHICPITGKVAKYLDPRTNVPYADLNAYRVLSKVLLHEYVWSPSMGCYVSKEGSIFSNGL